MSAGVDRIPVEGQAQFHPRRYLLELLDDLTRLGGLVFERNFAGSAGASRGTVPPRTGSRSPRRTVVVATHYPVFDGR